jgi:UDP:flavonoid glycosyltransferase YjiC (YdhE family)
VRCQNRWSQIFTVRYNLIINYKEEEVQEPPSPQGLNEPRDSGVIYFTEGTSKACFRKCLKENKQNP